MQDEDFGRSGLDHIAGGTTDLALPVSGFLVFWVEKRGSLG